MLEECLLAHLNQFSDTGYDQNGLLIHKDDSQLARFHRNSRSTSVGMKPLSPQCASSIHFDEITVPAARLAVSRSYFMEL